MSQQTIKEINSSQTFRFDKESSRVVNLKSGEETDIEEFLHIQHILDSNRIRHKFEKNFEIKIV